VQVPDDPVPTIDAVVPEDGSTDTIMSGASKVMSTRPFWMFEIPTFEAVRLTSNPAPDCAVPGASTSTDAREPREEVTSLPSSLQPIIRGPRRERRQREEADFGSFRVLHFRPSGPGSEKVAGTGPTGLHPQPYSTRDRPKKVAGTDPEGSAPAAVQVCARSSPGSNSGATKAVAGED